MYLELPFDLYSGSICLITRADEKDIEQISCWLNS